MKHYLIGHNNYILDGTQHIRLKIGIKQQNTCQNFQALVLSKLLHDVQCPDKPINPSSQQVDYTASGQIYFVHVCVEYQHDQWASAPIQGSITFMYQGLFGLGGGKIENESFSEFFSSIGHCRTSMRGGGVLSPCSFLIFDHSPCSFFYVKCKTQIPL